MNGTKRAFIFAGGEAFYPEALDGFPHPESGDEILAADGGLDNFRRYCECSKPITPTLILGDMDSSGYDGDTSPICGVPFRRYPPEKDDTDTALAVKTALERGCTELYIFGSLGGRIDHTLALVFLLEYIRSRNAEGMITDGHNRVRLAVNGAENRIKKSSLRYLSLIPLDAALCDVSIRGVKYPLSHVSLNRCLFSSVSNEITDDVAVITVGVGSALIVESSDNPKKESGES